MTEKQKECPQASVKTVLIPFIGSLLTISLPQASPQHMKFGGTQTHRLQYLYRLKIFMDNPDILTLLSIPNTYQFFNSLFENIGPT
jgi:hypothetical protein